MFYKIKKNSAIDVYAKIGFVLDLIALSYSDLPSLNILMGFGFFFFFFLFFGFLGGFLVDVFEMSLKINRIN